MEPLLIKVEDAAKALGLSRTAVFELIKAGALDSVQIGRRRRISVDAVRRYVATAEQTPAA